MLELYVRVLNLFLLHYTLSRERCATNQKINFSKKKLYCSLLTDYGTGRGQHTPNKALDRYFLRSNPDYDDFNGYRKRAQFRKRGMTRVYVGR